MRGLGRSRPYPTSLPRTGEKSPTVVASTGEPRGNGCDPADRGQIFDEFYQARTPLHATAKGTGLGLSFARRVATALGATIEVSTELGAGSSFVVVLPSTPEGGQP